MLLWNYVHLLRLPNSNQTIQVQSISMDHLKSPWKSSQSENILQIIQSNFQWNCTTSSFIVWPCPISKHLILCNWPAIFLAYWKFTLQVTNLLKQTKRVFKYLPLLENSHKQCSEVLKDTPLEILQEAIKILHLEYIEN